MDWSISGFHIASKRDLLVRIQHGQAQAASASISQFAREIESQWHGPPCCPGTRTRWSSGALMRCACCARSRAITEVMQLDADGRELFRMSRHAKDVIASQVDRSGEPPFMGALENKNLFRTGLTSWQDRSPI